MMGRPGNLDPRSVLAGRPRRGDRPARLARPPLPAGRHHDLQRLRRATAIPTTSGPTSSRSARSSGPATRPGTRASSRPSTAATGPPDRGRAGSRRGAPRSSTSRRSRASRPRGDERGPGGAGQALVLDAAGGRDPRADRRVRGVRGEDARPRRDDHDPGRRRAPGSRRSGMRSTSTDPDQRRVAVHALRARRLAALVVDRDLHPARSHGSRPTSPRRTSSPVSADPSGRRLPAAIRSRWRRPCTSSPSAAFVSGRTGSPWSARPPPP